MLFKDIYGLEDIKSVLKSSVQRGHIAHAQMFFGPEGTASLPLALAYATYINCENRTEEDSCGQCASCSKFNKQIHPDLFHLFPAVQKQNTEALMPAWRKFFDENPYLGVSEWLAKIDVKQPNISAEEARNLLVKLSYKAYEAEFKVVLIWLPEHMSIAAANSLLKVIEEPPSKTIFLVITHQVDAVIRTIQSRTQMLYVRPYKNNEIADILSAKYERSNAEKAASLCNGHLGLAMHMVAGELRNKTDFFAQWMRAVFKNNVLEIGQISEEFNSQTKEQQKNLLENSLDILRDLFLTKIKVEELVFVAQTDQKFIEDFSKFFNFGNFEPTISSISEAIYHIERNANARILLTSLSLKLAKLIR